MHASLSIVPLMWRALRPSRIEDMPAVANAFWLKRGYDALTFFGTILTHSEPEARRFNECYDALKNHEMIHLRQAQSTHDSWLCFYLLYIWYWLRALPYNRKMKHAAYLLNPFEIEAYRHMHNLEYLSNCPDGNATEWKTYRKMPLRERQKLWQHPQNDNHITLHKKDE